MRMVGFPWTSRALGFDGALGLCGSKTKIGMGAVDCVRPQTAVALIFCFVRPRSIPAKNVGILLLILTLKNAVGAIPTGGVVTPGTVVGKSTETLFPNAVLAGPIELLYPFSAA